ncbi:hypothetical protein NKI79_32345 [Mesorhizobium sp. M0340]|uniref:hypothetical protein n=1 Tax=Mesorhizobium sp. M0340 TaxID=2956939 RepID=UPI00333DC172
MKILDARPEPPGCGNVIARVDVALNDAVKIYNLKGPSDPMAASPFSRRTLMVGASSRFLVLLLPKLPAPLLPRSWSRRRMTAPTLKQKGSSTLSTMATQRGWPVFTTAIWPGQADRSWLRRKTWPGNHYTFKRELLQPRSDNEPADISEALRWCVVVDNIPECDADTAGIIYIERERRP